MPSVIVSFVLYTKSKLTHVHIKQYYVMCKIYVHLLPVKVNGCADTQLL